MSSGVFARRSFLFGLAASAFGIILYVELGRIVDFRVSLTVLNSAAVLSLSATLIGLLAMLTSIVIWLWHAPRRNLVYWSLSGTLAGVVIFSLVEFLDINIHGPAAIFLFVMLAGALACVLILLIAGIRFLLSYRPHQN
jgi:hypothetical protein